MHVCRYVFIYIYIYAYDKCCKKWRAPAGDSLCDVTGNLGWGPR